MASSPKTLLLAAALTVCVAAKATPKASEPKPIIDSAECDCFLTNGSSPSYYSHHSFFDFRSLPQHASTPPLITNASQAAIAPPTSAFFASAEWNSTWQIQGWTNEDTTSHGLTGNSTILMVNSPSNVFIQRNSDLHNSTYLTLRTTRLPGFQSAAAFQSRFQGFHFVSLRMLARTVGSPGAVSAMFLYRESPSGAVQEADLEVLTRGPREVVQYTNQPGFNPDGSRNTAASRNSTLPDALIWSDWAVHRVDWSPQRTTWFVDGRQTAQISLQVPSDAASLNFNAWSNGGSWSGNMSLYDEASLDIQWIEVVFNSSSAPPPNLHYLRNDHGPRGRLVRRQAAGNGKCKVVCSIDESPELGKTALLWNSTAAPIAGTGFSARMAWVWSLTLGSLLWYCLL